MKYIFYQVKNGPEFRDFRYTDYNLMNELNLPIDIKNYEEVYSGDTTSSLTKDALEELFGIFNMKHPKDYKGRSMSIGDVVVINGKSFFCDTIGWKLLSGNEGNFLK